jgi:phospholipase/carboxylesterase
MVPLILEQQPDLSSKSVFISAGSFDPIVPTSQTKQLAELLQAAGADVTIRFLQSGHQLMPDDVDLARQWLADLK